MEETDNTTDSSHRHWKRWLAIGLASFIVITAGGFAVYALTRPVALPHDIVKQVSFPIYYPIPIPSGYGLQTKSVKFNGDILFYKLAYGTRTITVTQQGLPRTPPNLISLPGFNELSVAAGDAVAGVYAKTPTVIITNNTTLITIIGSNNVPYDIVVDVAKALHSLPT